MTTTQTSILGSINKSSLIRSMLIGASIGICATLFFIIGAESQPHWPNLWQIRPLIITPLAGAIGGGLCYAAIRFLRRERFNSAIAISLILIGYLITLWLGIVLGLDGTLWD